MPVATARRSHPGRSPVQSGPKAHSQFSSKSKLNSSEHTGARQERSVFQGNMQYDATKWMTQRKPAPQNRTVVQTAQDHPQDRLATPRAAPRTPKISYPNRPRLPRTLPTSLTPSYAVMRLRPALGRCLFNTMGEMDSRCTHQDGDGAGPAPLTRDLFKTDRTISRGKQSIEPGWGGSCAQATQRNRNWMGWELCPGEPKT